MPASAQRRANAGVLGEEPVAGVDGVGAGLGGDGEHPLDVEVGGRAAAAERAGLVGLARVQRRGVVVGVDGDGAQPELGRRPQ